MGLRTALQTRIIDTLQFRLDTFPQLPYQPLPILDMPGARRSDGTVDRWRAIEEQISGVDIASAMDVGCQIGYFGFALASKGIPTLGVDLEERALRIARFAARKADVPDLGFLNMRVSPRTVGLLPEVDLVLVMSIWHHWVRAYQLEAATTILAQLWRRCGKVMFFETGEGEMPPDYGLPAMTPTPKEWLGRYLQTSCTGAEVVHLGQFKAFAPGGDNTRDTVSRSLFRVSRA